MHAVGGNRTHYLRLRHNCALSDELQPHAGVKIGFLLLLLLCSVSSVDKSVIVQLLCHNCALSKNPVIENRGVLVFLLEILKLTLIL